MQKIAPFLWFDSNAEEAAKFYVSVFKNSKIVSTSHYSDEVSKAAGRPAGSVMTVGFQIEGQDFTAINGGPQFTFSPAISFVVSCETQQEIDELWSKLSTNKDAEQCGWLQDKFGVSWQIVPAVLAKMIGDKDKEKSARVMAAIMPMKKLDLAALKRAFDGR